MTTKWSPASIPAQKGRRIERVMGVTYAFDLGDDACSWAVGIHSAGLFEAAYARVTEELTLVWARALLRLHRDLSFCSCSVGGVAGPGVWARGRRRVECALGPMPFRHVGAVRPDFIRPGPAIPSQTRAYQIRVVLLQPLFRLIPLLGRFMPFVFTTSETRGRAMLRVVRGQAERFILESADMNGVGA